jgi:hypothetical protein
MERLRKTMEASVRITGLRAEIGNEITEFDFVFP